MAWVKGFNFLGHIEERESVSELNDALKSDNQKATRVAWWYWKKTLACEEGVSTEQNKKIINKIIRGLK